MEATAGNSILDFETLFSDFQELLNASGLRWGWVFLERTRILSGIQFTTHFIDFFVVETKRFVGSTVNVIFTRQTYGQRSSRPGLRKANTERWEIIFPGEFATCS